MEPRPAEEDKFAGRRMWVKSVRATGNTASLNEAWAAMSPGRKAKWQEKALQQTGVNHGST